LLEKILTQNGTSLSNYPSMPHPTKDWDIQDNNPYLVEQLAYNHANEKSFALQHIKRLNADQLSAFNTTYLSVSCNLGEVFFLDRPAGKGKTFLYKALYHCVRGNGWIALCVASSGIAALLLPRGQTAHSTFAIPVQGLAENSTYQIDKLSKQADMLCQVRPIIWDEAVMQHR
jgi:hypothetical protein